MPKFRRSRALVVGSVLILLVAAFSVHYTVDRGDTLGQIARDHGVSMSELARANNISNPNLIFPGQVLTIPGQGATPDITHVVSRGETLNRIATQYGTSITTIVSANAISNPNFIRIGQKILIPSGSTTSSGGSNSNISNRSGQYHVVKRGESVRQIAAQYSGVTVDDIVRANGIVRGLIYAGAALYLNGPGFVASASEDSINYTVRSGDRLGDIAHRHRVSLNSLVTENNIANPNLIRKGQMLAIPSGSRWVCPVEGASYMNDWGFPRGGGIRYHEGNDLFVSRGTPVRAPVGGTVEFTTGTIGGLQFRLMGNDGVVYIGTHMDRFGNDGKVSAGEIIGYVGNTGNAEGTRPHLHFGVYYKGTVVNPYPTLVKHGC
ncbi:MAG TPA: LysM peptidoglycan-binding domain-containing M23 family metallopeptidase [Acidimicrobiia bacterium]|nr:LysM peptidoglycan-binding domain-containing M23 family metallopeptidase [Acidimicrobiia bacterium]